nr:hypothetical protein [uncultured Sphingomonas sp.]
MSTLKLLALSVAVVVPTLIPATPAVAQRVNEIVVFGNDPCPRSTDSDIFVCSRKSERERYRIPEKLRPSGTYQERQSWANRAKAFETYGRTGVNSCSPVGPGGWTGCTQQLIKQAFDERKEQSETDTAPEE